MSGYIAIIVSVHWLVACWKWASTDEKLDDLVSRLRKKGL